MCPAKLASTPVKLATRTCQACKHFAGCPLQMATGHKLEELAEEDHKWLSDDYKREVVEKMSVSQLVDTVSFTGVGWSAAGSTDRELSY